MMRAFVAAVLLAVGLNAACATDAPVGTEPEWLATGNDPEWLASLIQELESQPVANPPAFIARYDYRGQTVYYLSARCCDIPSNVYDPAGTVICHADGGLSGGGDGRCSDFLTARENERIVWRDPRGAT